MTIVSVCSPQSKQQLRLRRAAAKTTTVCNQTPNYCCYCVVSPFVSQRCLMLLQLLRDNSSGTSTAKQQQRLPRNPLLCVVCAGGREREQHQRITYVQRPRRRHVRCVLRRQQIEALNLNRAPFPLCGKFSLYPAASASAGGSAQKRENDKGTP